MARIGASLVAAALFASAVTASPTAAPISVPIRRPKLSATSFKDFAAKENARRSSFAKASAAASGTAPAINEDVTYVAATTVGSQTFDLIVDTGSSNTWVGSGTKFSAGSTGTSTGKKFSVSYGSGDVSGTEYTDTVSLGGVTVSKQSIGVASSSDGFEGVDGIIGFGPEDLTEDTVSGSSEIPTFLNNLASQGTISSQILGVSFAPESGGDDDDDNGELDLGAVDSSKFTGSIGYTDTTSTSPYSDYWGITVTETLSGSTKVGSSANAIVDTGTTLIYIPTTAYNAWLKAAGGTTDEDEGLATFSKTPTSNFSFVIGGVTYTLTPAEYIIPAAQNENIGLPSGTIYSWIADGGSEAADVNFIIGQKFLENFYAVFDTTNSRIGFAPRA